MRCHEFMKKKKKRKTRDQKEQKEKMVVLTGFLIHLAVLELRRA